MLLDRITVTGADDSTDHRWMAEVSNRYPHVEWGILLSAKQEGSPRFPTTSWIENLKAHGVPRLSGHLCGRWVRDLMLGRRAFEIERPTIARMFDRVQLNFHAEPHAIDLVNAPIALKAWGVGEYILQMDGEERNQAFLHLLRDQGVNVVPLFDTSGGAGIEPGAWTTPIGSYCGYAGGLHPDRAEEQIAKIAKVVGSERIWIDIETHVRSLNDRLFDPSKVEKFLDVASRFASNRKSWP